MQLLKNFVETVNQLSIDSYIWVEKIDIHLASDKIVSYEIEWSAILCTQVRETVCCLPSFTGHLLVCLPHFGLRPVRLDRLRICPFQSRQRQQNISLVCAHKAGLSFAKILNCERSATQFVFIELDVVHSERNKQVGVRCPTPFWWGKLKDRQR